MNGVEAVLIDGVEEVVEKSNAVDGLDLDHGEAGIALIVDIGPDGKGDGIIVVFPEEVVLCLKVSAGKIIFLPVDLIESHYHTHLPIVILNCLHVVGADPEDIEGYSVFPGVDVSGENVDFVGGQGAADFLEEKMAVVSCNGQFGIALLRIFNPLDGRLKRSIRAPASAIEVLPDGPDMSAHAQCVAVAEIALGHLPEMLVGYICIARMQVIPDFLSELVESATEFCVVGFVSLFEDGARRLAELNDEGFFPGAPSLFVGAVGIRIGEEQEGIHESAVLHESRELCYHIRIINIAFGGKTPEGEMMVDEEHDELSSSMSYVKAFADLVSQNLGAVDVLPDVLSSSGVVKQNGKVECVWIFNIDENLSVASNRRVVGFYQGIQLVDTA